MRRILRPAIGVGTTLAVAGATILIGMQFASPAAVATEDIGVLAPTEVDGQALAGDNDPETLDVSMTTGTARIVTPGSFDPDAVPAGVAEAIAALDASGPDPADAYAALGALGSSDDASDAPSSGDPCSPAEGTPPEDCPEGLHSAIFADTVPEDLEVWPYPGAGPLTVGVSIYCPDLVPGEGELVLGVGTNLPATVTARYWPVANPSDVRTVTLPGVAWEEAAWQAEIDATGTYTHGRYLFQHCAMMTGLEPNTDYIVSAFAIDVFSRISEPEERPFNSAGRPTVPLMSAVPLGSNLLYVAVPTTEAGDPPQVHAWVAPEGTAPDCSAVASGYRYLQQIETPGLVAVSADYLHDHNYIASFTRRVVRLYIVPEGSTVVVCARWFDTSAPVWERDTPTKQQSIVAMSPDGVSPIVTVTRLAAANSMSASTVAIEATGQFGQECGRIGIPNDDVASGSSVAIDEVVCQPAAASSEFFHSSGAIGNVVLTTTVGFGGRAVETRAMLPLNRYACVGVCDLPPTLTYTIPLPTVTRGAGLCSGSDCVPPTRETALGTAEVVVTWEQGNTNGRDSWSVGGVDDTPPDAPVPDLPQFDTDAVWSTDLSDSGWIGSAYLNVRADRHVTYTVSIAGDCFIGEPPAPVTGSTTRDSAGIEIAPVRFSTLCPGASYETTVELVDDAGARTVAARTSYGPSGVSGEAWWYGSFLTVPINQIEITGTVTITTIDTWNEGWWLVGTDVYPGTERARIYADYGESLERCYTGAVTTSSGTFNDTRVDQAEVIHLRTYTRVMAEALYYGVSHDALCDWPGANNYVSDVDLDVDFDDLLRGVTLEGDLIRREFPDERPQFHYRLTLTATRVTE